MSEKALRNYIIISLPKITYICVYTHIDLKKKKRKTSHLA